MAGVASLIVHAGLAVLILKTPLPAASDRNSWTTEVNFAGEGWTEYAPSPTIANRPSNEPAPPANEPTPQRPQDSPPPDAQPAPTPPPPLPKERFVRPGIDESTSDSKAWLGAAQATPHEAPLSQVDQAAQSMDPGLPGAPGTPHTADSPDAPSEPAGAQPQGSAPQPQAAPAAPMPPAPAAPTNPPPVVTTQAVPQPAAQPNPQPTTTSQPSAGPVLSDATDPTPGDEFAVPLPPAQVPKPAIETPQPTPETDTPQVDPAEPTPTPPPQPELTQPASETPPEPAPVEPLPIQPAPTEPAPTDATQASPAAPTETSTGAPLGNPAADVLGAPGTSTTSGQGGNLRAPGPRSDAESVAASRTLSMTFKPGQPLAGKGLRVRPAPLRLAHMTRMTAAPRNPIILIKFNRRGIVTDVEFENNQGTGFPDVDAPLRDSIFRWTATGKVLHDLPTHDPDARVTLRLEYLFRE